MAKYIEGQHIGNLQKTKLVFWTGGNEPTQKINSWTYNIVLNNLKLLYLLSGKVIASASYFFESPITQQVTDALKSFFGDGDIMYFFDDNLESPTEHAEKKISKSPKGLSAYRDKKTVLSNAKKLETLGDNLLRRPPLSISNKMVDLWIDEVLSTNNNSIGASIAREVSHYDKQNIIKKKLVDFARNREKDFVWDYIKPILVSFGLKNPYFHKMIQGKLAQMYALATANVLGVELDERLNYNLIDKNSKYDTSLFALCLKQLGILQLILQLDNSDLKQLKNSLDFEIFKEFYFKMIEDCQYQSNSIEKSIDTFKTIENEKQNNISRKEFVNKFVELNKLCNYPRRQFRKRLDEIKINLEIFNTRTGIVTNFVTFVQSKPKDVPNKDIINENIELKLKEYKRSAIKTICWYSVFIIIAICIFRFKIEDEKLDEVLFCNIKWRNVKEFFALLLFLVPMIRSFIKHDNVLKSFSFLFSKKEKAKIKIKFENEQNK